MDYNLFRASLITCSTGALASSFKIAVTTFCEGACANPSIVRAATASSCTCALAAVKAGPVMSTAPEAIAALTMLGFAQAPSQKVVTAILKEDANAPVEQVGILRADNIYQFGRR